MGTLHSRYGKRFRRRLLRENPSGKVNCHYCGIETPIIPENNPQLKNVMKFNSLTFDHFLPHFLGGTSCYRNMRVCCFLCNSKRGYIGNPERDIVSKVFAIEEYLAIKGNLHPDFYKYLMFHNRCPLRKKS